ncbi:MAG: lysophospholipid acyltransferase family protein [Verrucomicrobia bacterium]|nr:lysophospholipid acyltransferase family protein [Verrucomicrobiota bacterium]
MGEEKIQQLNQLQRFIMQAGALFLRLWYATLRLKLVDESGFFSGNVKNGAITLMWHNRIFAAPQIFRLWYRRKGISVITSTSRDGAYLSELLACLGIGSIRGSTSRRGAAALRDAARKLENGFDICITPDGPRGPRYRLQPGALLLATLCKVPLIPVSIEYTFFWRFKSWDGFLLPKPFSEVFVVMRPEINLEASDSSTDFESRRQTIEEQMLAWSEIR